MNPKNPVSSKPPEPQAQEMLKQFWTLAMLSNMDEALPMLDANPWLMKELAPNRFTSRVGQPFLQAAMLMNLPDLAAYGISHGAPLEDRCPLGLTALHTLMNCIDIYGTKSPGRFEKLIDLMVSCGARFDPVDHKGEPVWFRATKQPMAVWKQFTTNGAPLDFLQSNGLSGLSMLMLDEAEPDKVKHLVRTGANVNLFELRAMSNAPIMIALNQADFEMADLLLTHGLELGIKDKFEQGFLHHARAPQSVSWLAAKGLDLEEKDAFGKTPLLHLVHSLVHEPHRSERRYGMQEVAKAMILAGADLDARDQEPTSLSAREAIRANPKAMPELINMLRSMEARQVAMESLKEMSLPSP